MIGSGASRCASLAERAPYVLDDLAVATNCRARLGVLHELEVAYVEKCPGHQPVTAFSPAAKTTCAPTRSGRTLLAFSPPAMAEMTIERGLRPYTTQTVTSPQQFRRALEIVRLTRAAVTRHELEAQTCTVAMPVLGPGGGALAAIELTVPDLGATTLKSASTALTLATRSSARELTGASGPTRTTGPTAAPAAILVAASIVSRSPSSMTSPQRRASATTGTSPAHDWSFG